MNFIKRHKKLFSINFINKTSYGKTITIQNVAPAMRPHGRKRKCVGNGLCQGDKCQRFGQW